MMFLHALQRMPIKWQRLQQQCSIAAIRQQKAAWWLTFLAQVVDLLLLPDLIDLLGRCIKWNSRPLSALELAEARKVFGDSIPLEFVQIDESSMFAWIGAYLQRAPQMGVTIFYTIHFTRRLQCMAGSSDMGWLIHELVHVAQMYHVGSRYIWEAIQAQNSLEGYDYGNPKQLLHKKLADFNREQQGDIVRHYYDYVIHSSALPLFQQYYQAHYYEPHIADLQRGRI